MEKLAVHLALNGAMVLTASLVGGLLLHRSILGDRHVADWHLFHAGVSARGIMLLALAATIHLAALPEWQARTAAWLVIVFVWTSTLAMLVRTMTGEKGFAYSGAPANKVTFALYVVGTVAVFPGFVLLIKGYLLAL
jgi:hypothetical protein